MYVYVCVYIYIPCNLTLSHDFIWVNYKALTRQGNLPNAIFWWTIFQICLFLCLEPISKKDATSFPQHASGHREADDFSVTGLMIRAEHFVNVTTQQGRLPNGFCSNNNTCA